MAAQSQTTVQIVAFKLSRRTVQFVLRPVVLGIIVWIAYLAPPLTLGAIRSSVGTLRAVAARLRSLNFPQCYRATRGASGQRPIFSQTLTHWPLWLSAAGWIAFSAYCGAAAKNAAPSERSESAEPRRVHELLTIVGLLLLFIAVPALRPSFLPASAAWVPAGLALQAASFAEEE